MLDVTANDVEKIDFAGAGQTAGNLHAFIAAQPAFPVFIGHHAHADDEIIADCLSHRLQDHVGEAQPVVERSAIFVGSLVGGRRPEAVHQMAIGLEFYAVEAGCLHALGSRRIVGDNALDIPIFHFLRKRPVGRFTNG